MLPDPRKDRRSVRKNGRNKRGGRRRTLSVPAALYDAGCRQFIGRQGFPPALQRKRLPHTLYLTEDGTGQRSRLFYDINRNDDIYDEGGFYGFDETMSPTASWRFNDDMDMMLLKE